MKIAVVGAGSTYTPELVSGLSRERERLDVGELALHDIDAERREVVGALAQRMLDAAGFDGELLLTGDLDRAVEGADFVLIQIRVGGQEARLLDETVPLACGCIGQETTGAGGSRKALRTVPGRARASPSACASARPTAPGSSTSRTRSGSSRARCSTQATGPSASATSRSASSASSRGCSASSRSGSSSTRSG